MTIILDSCELPEKGVVTLNIERAFEIKITAVEAQRRVRAWLRDEISMLIDADSPTLVVGERVVWRVPVWIGFPHTGRAGDVGSIEVDVTSGDMNITPEVKTAIEQQAEVVAAQQPPYQPKEYIPEAYLAKNASSTPALRILEDGTLSRIESVPEESV